MRQVLLVLSVVLRVLAGVPARALRWLGRRSRVRLALAALLVPVFLVATLVPIVPPQIAQPVKPAHAAVAPEPDNPRDPLSMSPIFSKPFISLSVDVRTRALQVQVVDNAGPGFGQAGKIVHSLAATTDPCSGNVTGHTWAFNHQLRIEAVIADCDGNGEPDPARMYAVGPEGGRTPLEFDAFAEFLPGTGRWSYYRSKGGPWFRVKLRETCIEAEGSLCLTWAPLGTGPYYQYLSKGGYREYDTNGRILLERDANGNQATYAYGSGVTVTDEIGRVTTYNAAANPTTATDPYGRQVTFVYDAAGRMTASANVGGSTIQYAYTNGLLTRLTDARGNAYTFAYDAGKRVTSITYPDGSVVSYAFTVDVNCLGSSATAVTDPRGNVTKHCVREMGSILKWGGLIDPLGNFTRVDYDTLGNITSITDPLGRQTTFAWGGPRKLTRITNAQGKSILYTWDDNGNLLSITDPLNRVTQLQYDVKNNLTRITNALNQVTTYTYTTWGAEASMTDARGNTTTYEYDTRHRLTRVVPPSPQGPTTYGYDTFDNQTTVTDALGHSTAKTFSAMRQVLTITDALSNITRYTYDAGGNQTTVTDARGNVTITTYDNRDRVTAITQPGNVTTGYTYDPAGNLTQITLPNGRTVQMTYNARNEVTQTRDPLGQATSISHDALGNLLMMTDRKGVTTTVSYDNLYRVTGRSAAGQSVSFTYDDAGNRLTMTDPTGTTAYQYDALNRLTRVTWPDARFIAYTYDAVGNRATMTNPAGQTTTYTYDGANRLAAIADPTGSTAFTYDAAGNRTGQTLSNGATVSYTYNANNWLAILVNRDRSGTTISQFAYTYDPSGNRTQIVDQSGTSTFAYDARNQLTQAAYPDGRTVAYTYDTVGNRTQMAVTGPAAEGEPAGTTTYTYDANNRLTQRVAPDGTTTFTYDANGNLTQYTEPSGSRTYGYDPWNRLTSATDGSATVTYTYNGVGLMTRRQAPMGTQKYYYDRFAGTPRVIAEADGSSGTLQTVYHRDIFGNLLSDGVVWYQQDAVGSTVSRTNSSGTLIGSTLYGAWGTIRTQTGQQGKWGFAGSEWDADAKAHHMGARWYFAELGRFSQEDPAGGGLRGLNAYTYVVNNPLLFVDPTGLDEEETQCQTATCDPRNEAAYAALSTSDPVDAYLAWLGAAQAGAAPPPGWEKYYSHAKIASQRTGVPVALILAVMARETGGVGYNPNAIGRDGEIGLMQIMPSTAAMYGFSRDQLFDPATNVLAGAMHLKYLLNKYGRFGPETGLIMAISAYNQGEGNLAKYGINNNRSYWTAVLAYYRWFSSHL